MPNNVGSAIGLIFVRYFMIKTHHALNLQVTGIKERENLRSHLYTNRDR